MASGDVDELERGGLLAGDEDGKLETLASSTTTVTDADVQHSGCPPWRQRADSLWEPVLDNVRAAILACDMRTPRTAAHMPATPARSDRAERAEPGWIDSCV